MCPEVGALIINVSNHYDEIQTGEAEARDGTTRFLLGVLELRLELELVQGFEAVF